MLSPKPPSKTDEAIAHALGAITNLNDVLGAVHREIRTSNAAQLVGAQARTLTGQSQPVSYSGGRLVGLSLRETTGAAAAVVRLHDGADASGDLIATINIDKGESVQPAFPVRGVGFSLGLYLEIVSGAIEGAVYLGAM